jgi:uncharacterized OB-fold protein
MLHTTNLRRPRVILGQGRGLSKCVKCGVAFVAKHPAEQACSKCSISGKRTTRKHSHSSHGY